MALVRRTILADSDLADIWAYIAKDDVAAADRLIDRLVANHARWRNFQS